VSQFGTSQSVARVEDRRLLSGAGAFVDDIAPDGALRTFVIRSPVAHAEILTLDVAEARAAPGVVAVLTAQDLEEAGRTAGLDGARVTNRDGTKGAGPRRPVLATGRVRFVGEALAMVVAETYAQARDAAELVVFDFKELEVKVDVAPGGALIHPEAPDNRAYDFGKGDEAATMAALASAPHVVKLTVNDNRIIANSLEPRGCYAEIETDGRLHVCVNAQGVWGPRDAIAAFTGRAKEAVRVTTPDVGGGFGMKALLYPETLMVAHLAEHLGRPVHWMAERTESMLSDNAGRDLICTATLGFDADHRLVAYRMDSVSNMGAYNSGNAQVIQSELFAKVLPGVYDVQAVFMNNVGVYTNTTQVDAYRGAGRPEAIYVLERAMDYAARELGVDPFVLRRKSFIPPEKFPYTSAMGELYDVGDFARLLDRAEQEADLAGFSARRAASEADGKLRGMGLCYYIESILGNPEETAAVEFAEDGTVLLYVGTQSNGQGHETVYTQFLCEWLGVPPDAVRIIQGDTARIAKGGGTGGSRSVTTQGTATRATTAKVIAQFTPFVAAHLGLSDVAFEDGVFRGVGSNRAMTVLEAAAAARTQGRTDLLHVTQTTRLPGRSYPNGAHICEIEIDRDTGVTQVVKYTVVDDFGNLMNPMLVEGQIHGGVAQGIGQAIMEHVVHDADGQLLTATFMDYGMPRADSVPMIAFQSVPVPSTANVLGMKGCGEAGTVGAMAAVGNAALDALWPLGLRQVDMPFTPSRVWQMLQDAEGGAIAAE
jgi:carbon-monoxide dehydrogenase large subunit